MIQVSKVNIYFIHKLCYRFKDSICQLGTFAPSHMLEYGTTEVFAALYLIQPSTIVSNFYQTLLYCYNVGFCTQGNKERMEHSTALIKTWKNQAHSQIVCNFFGGYLYEPRNQEENLKMRRLTGNWHQDSSKDLLTK